MALTPNTKHFSEGLQSLIPPFWGKPRIASLLRAILNRVQELEDDAHEVMNAFNVDTADATRLEILGRVVGQPNFGWGLETYRAVIKAKIATNRSRGREDDIATVIQLAAGVTGTTVTALGNANMLLTLPGAITDDALEALLFLLPKARAAGVGQMLQVSGSTDPDEIFLWGEDWATDEVWAGAVVL